MGYTHNYYLRIPNLTEDQYRIVQTKIPDELPESYTDWQNYRSYLAAEYGCKSYIMVEISFKQLVDHLFPDGYISSLKEILDFYNFTPYPDSEGE